MCQNVVLKNVFSRVFTYQGTIIFLVSNRQYYNLIVKKKETFFPKFPPICQCRLMNFLKLVLEFFKHRLETIIGLKRPVYGCVFISIQVFHRQTTLFALVCPILSRKRGFSENLRLALSRNIVSRNEGFHDRYLALLKVMCLKKCRMEIKHEILRISGYR